jgi:type VI secretion system protein ImpL
MTIKSLLFLLFLYICLVWVGAAYLYSGPELTRTGLLWTGAGLLALISFIILSRLIGWWRIWRIRKSAKASAAAPKPPEVVHEDDAALTALLAEADANLAKLAGRATKTTTTPLSGRPVYFLVGPEGAGKTSTFIQAFLNAGVTPQLIAGQVAGATAVVPTRLCNIWLVEDALFVELAGRTFTSELGRWKQLLALLRGTASRPLWRRIFSDSEETVRLRGVVAFCDAKEFTGAPNVQRMERMGREWQERLRAIGSVFEIDFPVYQVITKSDGIKFFSDFFQRLPDWEVDQVLGCSFRLRERQPVQPANGPAEPEPKQLTRSFRNLYHALAERRLTQLAHEPVLARRPGIYEFPREMKRLRTSLIDFLSEAFRPDLLHRGPLLRGFYFAGALPREGAPDPGTARTNWSASNTDLEVTRLFSGDATQIFRAEDSGRTPVPGSSLRLRWHFVADLFRQVILADRPPAQPAPVDDRLIRHRRAALACVCGLCIVLCAAFTVSWVRNRRLVADVNTATLRVAREAGAAPAVSGLQSLDALRVQVERLTAYDRNGAPWSLRWGLYSGDDVLAAARSAYFHRLQQVLLNPLNAALAGRLESLPATPSASDVYDDPAYRELKTHLTITSGACDPEPALVSAVLKATLQDDDRALSPSWQALAGRQIDFYAGELRYGNPCRLAENVAARDHARRYLWNIKNVDRLYLAIIADAEKALGKPRRLADFAPNYALVLKGPGEMSPAFTQAGLAYVGKAAKQGSTGALGESCVMGGAASSDGGWKLNAGIEGAIQRMYVRDYTERWRKFLASFSVTTYASPDDAARKLEVLAGHRSPLLALFLMTGAETNFPAKAPEGSVVETARKIPLVGKIVSGVQKAEKKTEKAAGALGLAPEPVSGPADIMRSFQPVHSVVPPGSETWVVEQNAAYVDALAQLRLSMQEIARGAKEPDPAVHQAAAQTYDKAMEAVRQISRKFKPMGVAGLDTVVQRLMEEPIRLTKRFIIADMDKALAGKINGELRTLCAGMSATIRKYPFRPGQEEVTLEELANLIAPQTGAIWKFQAQVLADFVVKDGARWKPADPAKKPQVTPELLAFLNRAQTLADVFYPPGSSQPRLTFTLRPIKDDSTGRIVEMEIDGQTHQWTTFQHTFSWPGEKASGAVLRVKAAGMSVPVISRGGVWGLFRLMGHAEPRPMSHKIVEWTKGGIGRLEPIQPPIRFDIVDFPRGVDVFNPKFFESWQCPSKAVQ